jgi:gluconokinase
VNRRTPPLVVVMGVSGAGKSTVGRAVAERLGVEYADGDDFHSAANVAAMQEGFALDDEQRRPWLDSVGSWLQEHHSSGGVISCSALRRVYRDHLTSMAPDAFYLHLVLDDAVARSRMEHRTHFMPSALLKSQLELLEPLEPDEQGATVDAGQTPEEIAEQLADQLAGDS